MECASRVPTPTDACAETVCRPEVRDMRRISGVGDGFFKNDFGRDFGGREVLGCQWSFLGVGVMYICEESW